MTSYSDALKKVVLLATELSNHVAVQCCMELLKMKKLEHYHFHITVMSQEEDFLSSLVVMKELNRRLFLHQTDVLSEESVKSTIENVVQAEGKIDILVCHIEKRFSMSASQTTSTYTKTIFDRNFYPNLHFITNVIPHMKADNRGKIILINSYAGMQGISHSSAYCAARFALNGLLQSIAGELVSSKISVCVLQTVLAKSPPTLLSQDFVEQQHEDALSDIDRELIQNIEDDLENQKLFKCISVEKLAKTLKTLFTKDFPDLKTYLNKISKQLANDKFIDAKGTTDLSETTKFYLNIDLHDFRGPTSSKGSSSKKMEFLKENSPFACRGKMKIEQ